MISGSSVEDYANLQVERRGWSESEQFDDKASSDENNQNQSDRDNNGFQPNSAGIERAANSSFNDKNAPVSLARSE